MKVMILGANVYQLPVIRRAKALGHEVIVCSRAGDYPGIALADRFFAVDTTDVEACLSIAVEEEVDGVLAPGTDVATLTLAEIVQARGLCGPTVRCARLSSDKRLMKAAFLTQGVRTADYLEVDDLASAQNASRSLGFPLMVKVADSSGSRGIHRAADVSELETAYRECRSLRPSGKLILETFLDGEEFGAQVLVVDGEVRFTMLHGDVVRRAGSTATPIGHYVPYPMEPKLEQDAVQQVELAVEALGINNCAVNVDLMVADGRVYVLELGARSGATCLAEMVSAHYGVDYYEIMLEVCLGKVPEGIFQGSVAVAGFLTAAGSSGRLCAIEYPTLVDVDVVERVEDIPAGAWVNAFVVGPDRIGHTLITGSSSEVVAKGMEVALRGTKVVVDEPHELELQRSTQNAVLPTIETV